MTRRKFLWLGTAVAALARCPALAANGNLRAIARDAFVYVLPLIEMAATRVRVIAHSRPAVAGCARSPRTTITYAQPTPRDEQTVRLLMPRFVLL